MKKSNKDAVGYEVDSAMPLTPFQLLTIRSALLASNRIEDLQFWVIILVSVKLFLRAGEATGDVTLESGETIPTGLRFESFEPSLTTVEGSWVKSISVRIKGRTDTTSKIMTLWADDAFPEFCPVRHLLAYIFLIRFEGGHLFPPKSCLPKPDELGLVHGREFSTWTKYDSFHKR